MLAIVKTMKNPRSAVLKTSVMVCTDVFNALGNLISTAGMSNKTAKSPFTF